ncbi:uncharacterized protein SPPG_04152 [Spizellomyces punctatus DAOM BR117]|uniref:C2 domain-containing protein n=1 Tax=Spizellomyces punctatus (strain DAOM BR117) TaxID=645134 RepID=A0A0L0HJL6_SPIPD|nr:uncharacterized protein SPPG_04152 [Spizellomyces punctatus DAOM BR117]KND01060.1 hypothetical protein SPPG_04152 [Spizellomyces punctatus DAOM BR117]|eukprot:XP_016609099.1 hypothetical protein SPPG_04152 [Spizellomyces punctatus DAOM BR117]
MNIFPRTSSLPSDDLPPALPPRPPAYAPTDTSGPAESTTTPPHPTQGTPYSDGVDVAVTFIGARDLPKMDIIGTADPYFRATIDNCISYCSTCISNTLTPTWNETWKVNNVPSNAILYISVWDKDLHVPNDEIVGKCQTPLEPTTHTLPLTLSTRHRGTITLSITTTPASPVPPYTFAGPVRHTIHYSPLLGALTRQNDTRPYATWKIHLTNIETYFSSTQKQHWNTAYKAAQTIFSSPMSFGVKSGIQAAHRMLYARTGGNGGGILQNGYDFMGLLFWNAGAVQPAIPHPAIPKPCMYTYIIDDETLRFSETGAAFLVDFASKHALHSNCSEYVRFAGEFHVRPLGGWDLTVEPSALGKDWQVVMDNNSGTYAPGKELLPALERLMKCNFGGLDVVVVDRQDGGLVESRNKMAAYASKYFNT